MSRVIICAAALASVFSLGGMALMIPQIVVAQAAPKSGGEKTETTFLIPANDGYGVADCISSNKTCGKIVADAWCQNHGYKVALNYGVADRADFTGSVPKPTGNDSGSMPMVVNCSN